MYSIDFLVEHIGLGFKTLTGSIFEVLNVGDTILCMYYFKNIIYTYQITTHPA